MSDGSTRRPIGTMVYRPPTAGPGVIYRDESIVVVDKPSELLAVPGIGPDKADCVRSRVQELFPDATGPMTCHRLDLSTSGVMVLGLDAASHRNLSIQFEQRRVVKQYVALVEGHLQAEAGRITVPMRKDMDTRPLMLVDHDAGKPSETLWRLLSRETLAGEPVSRIVMEPQTGRTHQLRVHAAHPRLTVVGEQPDTCEPGLGKPIVGDDLYQGKPASRLMLHAWTLTIHHPTTGKRLSFSAPVPF